MNSKFNILYLVIALVFMNGCSIYSEEDYGEAETNKRESSCVNMEPSPEAKCKEREQALIISLGADENCNHPYEYERNKCKNEKVKQKKQLDESLKKHVK